MRELELGSPADNALDAAGAPDKNKRVAPCGHVGKWSMATPGWACSSDRWVMFEGYEGDGWTRY